MKRELKAQLMELNEKLEIEQEQDRQEVWDFDKSAPLKKRKKLRPASIDSRTSETGLSKETESLHRSLKPSEHQATKKSRQS